MSTAALGQRAASALEARLRRRALTVVVALALVIPQATNPSFSYKLALGACFATTILSLVVLTGLLGQISLAQAALMAVGAYTAAHLGGRGWPLLVVLLLSGLVAVPIGVLVGLPSLRLRGIYLAVATLSFALAFDTVVPDIRVISGGNDGVTTPRPSIGGLSFGGDRTMWYLTAAVFALLAWLVVNMRRGRTGRAFTAIRDNEVAAAAAGLSVTRYKLQGFAFAAFIAGVGGGLYAYTVGTPAPVDLQWWMGVQLVLLAVIASVGAVSGAALAGFLNWVALPLWVLPVLDAFRIHVLPFFKHQGEQMIPLFFGLLLLVQLNTIPEGLALRMARDGRRLLDRPRRVPDAGGTPPVSEGGADLGGVTGSAATTDSDAERIGAGSAR